MSDAPIRRLTAPVVAACFAVVAFAAGWIGHGLIFSPTDASSMTVFDRWRVLCPKASQADQSCVLTQDLVNMANGATILRFTVTASETQPTVDILAPHNVLLPAGLGVKLGDEPVKSFAFRTCNLAGCLATIPADSAFYNDILHAKQIQVFLSDLSGKSTGHTLSMASFDTAVAAMSNMEAKRHSWIRRALQ